MSNIIGRSAFRATRRFPTSPIQRRCASGVHSGHETAQSSADKKSDINVLRQGARKDPELYALLAIMTTIFGVAGWHFSRSPTSSSSENPVAKAKDSEPWKTGGEAKYQYHPGGDESVKKDAPSALNTVIIPNVNLPKNLHDKYNKWGKEGY